jgi:hypothetical protein
MYLGAWDTCCALRDRSSACFMAFFVHVCQYRIRLCPSSPHDHLPSACTVLSLVISVAVRYCGACRRRTRESEPEGEPEDTGAQNQPGHPPEGEATTVAGRLACGRAGGRG